MPGGLRWKRFILKIGPYTKCARLQKLAIITHLDKSTLSEVVEELSGWKEEDKIDNMQICRDQKEKGIF